MIDKFQKYTVIVPSLERAGPVVLAIDLAISFFENGYDVEILYLKNKKNGFNIPKEIKLRRFNYFNFYKVKGLIHSHCLVPDILNACIKFFNFNNTTRNITTVPSFVYHDMKMVYGKNIAYLAWKIWTYAIKILDDRYVISKTMIRFYKKSDKYNSYKLIYHSRREDVITDSDDIDATVNKIKNFNSENKFNIIYIAGLHPRKNLINLIDEIIKNENIGITIFGDGPLKYEIIKYSNLYKDKILYLGFNNKAQRYIQFFDALVLPSLAEGFPTVTLESIRCNRPVLLSNITIHRELANLGMGIVFDHINFSNFKLSVQKVSEMGQSDIFRKNSKYLIDNLFDNKSNAKLYE